MACHGGKRRVLTVGAETVTLCMRCNTCPGCGAKYRKSGGGKLVLVCLVCGDLEHARRRKALMQAVPMTGSMFTITDYANVSSVWILYAGARFGIGTVGRGADFLPTRMKVLRRTDSLYAVYGGAELWPNATLYVGPTMLDACIELSLMLRKSMKGTDHVKTDGKHARSAGSAARPREEFATDDRRRAHVARGSGAKTASDARIRDEHPVGGTRASRRFPQCGHKRPAGTKVCGICAKYQSPLF